MKGFYQDLAGERAELVSLRRHFHRNAELSNHEYKTCDKIEQELDALGIAHQRIDGTGVFATLTGGKPGTGVVMLRADIDALPIQEESGTEYASQNAGVMHACGHDLHTACLLGAAKALAGCRSELSGTVRLFFQQAEEVGDGAHRFLEHGLLDGVQHVFGLHSAPDLPVGQVGVKPGPNNASVDHFTIRIHGKAAHVSTPEKGADALYAAARVVTDVQAIATRRLSPIHSAIIGIGKLSAGRGYNIVAEEAVLEGTTRLFTAEDRAFVDGLVEQTAKTDAALLGCTCEVAWKDYASPLVNDAQACREIGAIVTAMLGAGACVTDRELSCGGDDFAEYLLRVPGCYAYVGTAAADVPGSAGPAHNSHFDLSEDALTIGAALYAEAAWHYLMGE